MCKDTKLNFPFESTVTKKYLAGYIFTTFRHKKRPCFKTWTLLIFYINFVDQLSLKNNNLSYYLLTSFFHLMVQPIALVEATVGFSPFNN